MSLAARLRARRGAHAALFYSGEREYVEGVGRFLAPAIATGAPVVIAAPKPGLECLRESLEEAGERFELLDMVELGVNPARIIPTIGAAIEAHPGEVVYFVAELDWAGRGQQEIAEATRHEALVNRAFRRKRVEILCPYDLDATGAEIVADAERTHPLLCRGEGRSASAAYLRHRLPPGCDAPLPPAPHEARSLRFELGDLTRVRALVSEQAGRAGLPVGRCGDLVLAAGELATNSIRHGGGSGTIRVWRSEGRLTCEVSDAGRIKDPLAGLVRPQPGAHRGRGLWIVNQLCDLVQIRSDAHGTTVRIHATARSRPERPVHALTGQAQR
jgi:anti-sigma regulatory factor (Ser/Thr protein kinase)